MANESQLFPATYRTTFTKQLKPLFYASMLFLLAMFGRAHLGFSSPIWMWALTFLVVFVLAPLLAFGTAMCRVTLYDDHIEKRSWLGKKTWQREDVARIWPRPHGGGFWLVHRHNSGYFFEIPAGIERDAAWDAWLRDIPEYEDKISKWFRGSRGRDK